MTSFVPSETVSTQQFFQQNTTGYLSQIKGGKFITRGLQRFPTGGKPQPYPKMSLRQDLSQKAAGVVPNTAEYQQFQERQRFFCTLEDMKLALSRKDERNDGKLVWQKLPQDKIVRLGTAGLLSVCFGMSVLALARFSLPKKFPRPERHA